VRQSLSLKQGYRAWPLPQSFGVNPVLDAVFKHHLHSHANAKHGPSRSQALVYKACSIVFG
jgi:hypothetical protein